MPKQDFPIRNRSGKYDRILLKLSGEMLGDEEKNRKIRGLLKHIGRIKDIKKVRPMTEEIFQSMGGSNISPERLKYMAHQIQEVREQDVEIAIVIGGGNIYRGNLGAGQGIDRVAADYMGMLATIMNAVALNAALKKLNVETRVQTALEVKSVAEPYVYQRAVRHMEKGRVIIIGGGTGIPFATTDSAAAQHANEIKANVIIKATKVNGVYTEDPHKNPKAKKYDTLDFMTALKKQLKVMDGTAFSLCMDTKMPVIVLDLNIPHNLKRAAMGEKVGTLVV